MKRFGRWTWYGVACAVVVGASHPSHAVVETIDAAVAAEVEERVDGAVINTERAFQSLDETTGNLPLVAHAELFRVEDGEEASAASARMTFRDPRLSVLPNPEEFGVDLVAFSRLAGIAYRGLGQATEEREITFTAAEIGAPGGTALQARSLFFVDGIVLLWGELGVTNLDGTGAEVELTVDQVRPDTADAARVLRAQLRLSGTSDGGAVLSMDGDLAPENVVLVDLSGQLPDFGAVHLLIVPATSIPYVYPAQVDVPFVLTARVNGTVVNEPGTGASVVLGLPLASLLAVIAEVTGAAVADTLEGMLEQVLDSGPSPTSPLVAAADAPTEVTILAGQGPLVSLFSGGGLCGLLGIESALALTVLATSLTMASRSGRRRVARFGRPETW